MLLLVSGLHIAENARADRVRRVEEKKAMEVVKIALEGKKGRKSDETLVGSGEEENSAEQA